MADADNRTTLPAPLRPLLWEDRRAGLVAGLVFAWLLSIELGTSRKASREAATTDRTDETVIDTSTSRIADVAFTTALVGGTLSSRLLPQATIGLRRTAYLSGVGGLVLSGLLSVAARRHLGRFHRDSLTIHGDHRLVDTGPYRHVRHPLYTATLGSFLAIGALLGNWVSLAIAALPGAALIHRIGVEEDMLVDALGTDYVNYRKKTKRLIPNLW